ncbi:LacI family DNA-binding transcriptional regulator [Sphingomonas sp. RS6]
MALTLRHSVTMTSPRAPRLDEVAELAGVSPATVSRFLNNPVMVAPATGQRIRKAIEETGYLPNLNAGALASSRSRLISVLVPEIAQSIFNDTVEAMVNELAGDGNSVMLSITGADNELLTRQIDAALSRRVDAIILTGLVTDENTRQKLRRQRATVIETWALPSDPIDIAIGFSHHEVGRGIGQFVMDRGYRRPHLVVPQTPRALERAAGFESFWTAAGNPGATVTQVPAPSHFGQGRLAFRELAELPAQPDVVICGSDWIAQGLIVEAQSAGVPVPGRLAVIGFGNLRLAGDMRPTITSVDIDGRFIAREVMRVLKDRAENRPLTHRSIDVRFKVIARESA